MPFSIKQQAHTLDQLIREYAKGNTTTLLDCACGFKAIQWLLPEASGYYQPIALAYKS